MFILITKSIHQRWAFINILRPIALLILSSTFHLNAMAQEASEDAPTPLNTDTESNLFIDADEITALIDRYYRGYVSSFLTCMNTQGYNTPGVVCTNLQNSDQIGQNELHEFIEAYTDFKIETEQEFAMDQLSFQCSEDGLEFYRSMSMEEYEDNAGRSAEAEMLASSISSTFNDMGLSMLGADKFEKLLIWNKHEKQQEAAPNTLVSMMTMSPPVSPEPTELTPYEVIKEPCEDEVIMARRVFEISNQHPQDKYSFFLTSGLQTKAQKDGAIYSVISNMQKFQSEGNEQAAMEFFEEGKSIYDQGLLTNREAHDFWISSATVHYYQNDQATTLAANEKAFEHLETGRNFLVPATLIGNYMEIGDYEKALEMALHLQEHYYSDAPNAGSTNTARSLTLARIYLHLGDMKNVRVYSENTPISAEEFIQSLNKSNAVFHIERKNLQDIYDVYLEIGDNASADKIVSMLDEWDSLNSL